MINKKALALIACTIACTASVPVQASWASRFRTPKTGPEWLTAAGLATFIALAGYTGSQQPIEEIPEVKTGWDFFRWKICGQVYNKSYNYKYEYNPDGTIKKAKRITRPAAGVIGTVISYAMLYSRYAIPAVLAVPMLYDGLDKLFVKAGFLNPAE